MTRRRRTTVIFAVAAFITTASASAQSLRSGTYQQCFTAAPHSELRRVAGFIRSDAAESAPFILKPADLLVETLGERVRASLAAKPGDLPIGEPTFTKDNTGGAVVITLYRDGRFLAVVRPDSDDLDSSRVAGTVALAKLLRQGWDDGDRVFWPDRAKQDSATFNISFWTPPPKRDGSVVKAQARFAVAVFSIAVPWVEQATVDDLPDPVYPDGPRSRGVQGTITMSFVVDTTGYALISTARDVLPFGAPIPVGEMAEYYREFVRAVAEALPRARFHAATIAGCRYRQEVSLPFKFTLH